MSTYALKPWTEIVRLHPDVENDALTEAMFAIDLGAIAANDPGTPAFYRDARVFFQATHITTDLGRLLEEVLAVLAGGPDSTKFNRVLKLRTHFGGGKSHVMAALLHAARDSSALGVVPEASGYARPTGVKVAVFDGEKFDARDGKTLSDGRVIKTMWGWIAQQLDRYEVLANHDKDMVSPGGDRIAEMLEGGPKLILLDEVLKYMERAAAVGVLDSTLQRQAMDFIQNLTVEIGKAPQAAMVYSLQWSAREAFGNMTLLEQIDKVTSRVDQLREPVSGDEILSVLRKRLLASRPPEAAAEEVAGAFADELKKMRVAFADTPLGRSAAEDQAAEFQARLKGAYPFHPALIDIMKDRWASVLNYQRTRGALRFLATCMHSLKAHGGARALLGPGDIPLGDADVRRAMLKDLAPQQEYEPVIGSDIVGPNAKAKKIDERYAKEDPKFANVKPATKIAAAILAYSFGGLQREGGNGASEILPSGVTESELLGAVVGPDLDRITASSVLGELKTTCLYLHFDGVRYCFKKDPNVVKLIEDAEQEVSRDSDGVSGRVKAMLEARVAGRASAIVWPRDSSALPDREPLFMIGYLPLEFASLTRKEQEAEAKRHLFKCGDGKRVYRNGVAIAIPDRRQVEPLRRAVRYLLAIERVEQKKNIHKLSKDQMEQLKERRQTEERAAETAFRALYTQVWLPKMASGEEAIEVVESGGRPLQAPGVHDRMLELLTAMGRKWVHTSVTPQKLVDRVRLGEAAQDGSPSRMGVGTADVVEAFFCFLDPPRIESDAVLRRSIAKGVSDGTFGYCSGPAPTLGPNGCFQVALAKVTIGRTMTEDEVDLETGFLMAPAAFPQPTPAPVGGTAPTQGETPGVSTGSSGAAPPAPRPMDDSRTSVSLRFAATRDQVFKAFPAIANLADKADGGKVTIQVEAKRTDGFDPAWLRNAVEEPLDEANVDTPQNDSWLKGST